jgi:transcriptional regulator with XRE-family HTH domain
MSRKGPNTVDKIVGRNIRMHRLAKGLSQTELGEHLGVTFQQVQKYEKGSNRVGSGRLYEIATVLGVRVTEFFAGGEQIGRSSGQSLLDLLSEPHSLRLAQAFSRISDKNMRRSLVQLVERIASTK